MFTQPLMYKVINEKKNVLEIFESELTTKHKIDTNELEKIKEEYKAELESNFQEATSNKFNSKEWVPLQWTKYLPNLTSEERLTGSKEEHLKNLGEKMCSLPSDINFHPQIKKIYETRLETIRSGKGIDWGTAESLAWASLIVKGHQVRISGQDVERGTFSHRHCVIYDQDKYKKHVPLHKISPNKDHFQACNSHLSEFAVLGFELGYSYYNPESLTIWEAQFGDFANGGQVITDCVNLLYKISS